MRRIPATMATQHPDNAGAPYWGSSPFISTVDEVEECYRAFCDQDIDEYMWDWEGKFVDEAVLDRLFNRYSAYFHKKQLGKDKFLTYRIPNIWRERGTRLARAFMTILTAAHSARGFGVHTPPIFEVILPMTTSAKQLITIFERFRNAAKYEQQIFEDKAMDSNKLEMIPLIEGSATLMESLPILLGYAKHYEKALGKKPHYIRPFIARSDPALDAGYIAATLSARAAISEYYRFQKETKIAVYPILGAGAIGFRGGLAPDNLDRFLKLYGGIRTVTLQSAFRYDYPQDQVKSAIAKIKRKLPQTEPIHFDEKEIKTIMHLINVFAGDYRPKVIALAETINGLAKFIPSRRERIPHTGHFGYSRKIGKSQVQMPRAIAFTATLYSLGVPPALIGTGHALKTAIKQGHEEDLHYFYPGWQKDIIENGKYLNWENLKFLAKSHDAWQKIWDDVKLLEDYLGQRLEPKTPEDFIHRNYTSNIYHLWKSGQEEALKDNILRAACARKSLG